jgi:hypothetical protein
MVGALTSGEAVWVKASCDGEFAVEATELRKLIDDCVGRTSLQWFGVDVASGTGRTKARLMILVQDAKDVQRVADALVHGMPVDVEAGVEMCVAGAADLTVEQFAGQLRQDWDWMWGIQDAVMKKKSVLLGGSLTRLVWRH